MLQEEEFLLVSFDSMKLNAWIGDFFIPRITLLSTVQVFLLSAKCISNTQLPALDFLKSCCSLVMETLPHIFPAFLTISESAI